MIIIIILRDSKIYSMRPFFLSRVLGAKIPQAVTRREAHTLQSLRSLSLSTDTALYCGRAHPIMMYGTCQCPWGESVQKLLQVLAMATSRVDMSQHWTTSNFSSFCALEETDFFFFLRERGLRGGGRRLYIIYKTVGNCSVLWLWATVVHNPSEQNKSESPYVLCRHEKRKQ